MEQKYNPSIGCNVSGCKYNCTEKQACSLDKIYVSDAKSPAKKCKDTLCDSFACRTDGQ
ncbi:MAG: DUF1540 domain-containing protein [Clostridia bacterium]|nr:DUF1540 domain-containing protein [Clostridia bacterium]